MKRALILAAVGLIVLLRSAVAGTFSFNGSIERSDPYDYGGLVTNDFIKLKVNSSSAITLLEKDDVIQGLSFGLYTSHYRDGDLVFDSVALDSATLIDGTIQLQGSVSPGIYYVALYASIAEWNDLDGIDGTSHADAPPEVGYGNYLLTIEGDLSVSNYIEGQLPYQNLAEPTVPALGISALLTVLGFNKHNKCRSLRRCAFVQCISRSRGN